MSGLKNEVRVRLGQIEVLPGQPWANTEKMVRLAGEARADEVDLLVFPELAVPGYIIGDQWEYSAFLAECEECTEELRRASIGITLVFGNVAVDWQQRNEDGRPRKYNALFVACDGQFHGPEGSPRPFVVKALSPNYRAFDESRYFFDLRQLAQEEGLSPAELTRPVKTPSLTLGCALCEDIWDDDYAFSPLANLADQGLDLVVTASCSPYTFHKNHKRTRLLSRHAAQLGAPLIYVNNTGIQNNGKTVFTFDGSSCIYDTAGGRTECATPHEESCLTVSLPRGKKGGRLWPTPALKEDCVADLHRAIEYGTERFMRLCGLERVTIGISGGIDSALVAAIYSRILPPENLLLVNMPGAYSSTTTRSLANTLAENLGALYTEVPIGPSLKVTRSQIDGLEIRQPQNGKPAKLNLTEFMLENVQARDRSSRILSAVSNAFGGVFTCNANKAEVTVGYTTLYGDLGGYLANIADLWKQEVYQLAAHLNQDIFGREVIPQGSIDIPPSAELNPQQNVDQGQGDPLHYPYHDALFRSWVERWNRATPTDILSWYQAGNLTDELGINEDPTKLFPTPAAFIEDLEKWWNQFQGMGLAKRIQAPPILGVKRRVFGYDYRESQLGTHFTRAYHRLKAMILETH